MDNDSDNYSDEKDVNDAEEGWIKWFCNLEGNELFVEVDSAFFKSKQNLFGIPSKFKDFE